MYVSDVIKQDWDEYTERLTFAMKTAQDRVRKEPLFYLVHAWDASASLEATLPVVNTRRRSLDRADGDITFSNTISEQDSSQDPNVALPGSRERRVRQEVSPPLAWTFSSSRIDGRRFPNRARVDFDEYLLPEDSCEESLRKVKEVLEAPLKRRRNMGDSNRSSLLVGKGMQIPLDGWGGFELWSLTPGL
ncbi:unnamed protein product [Peronospora belbahrii]|uniref:Uncharacterized protein n=1 Tax=Peronospora belbahrii TaxID=622444 RepID=A0ABN8DAL5_9STRA|nr:unnamed protein product [Peronospora belbahrii]